MSANSQPISLDTRDDSTGRQCESSAYVCAQNIGCDSFQPLTVGPLTSSFAKLPVFPHSAEDIKLFAAQSLSRVASAASAAVLKSSKSNRSYTQYNGNPRHTYGPELHRFLLTSLFARCGSVEELMAIRLSSRSKVSLAGVDPLFYFSCRSDAVSLPSTNTDMEVDGTDQPFTTSSSLNLQLRMSADELLQPLRSNLAYHAASPIPPLEAFGCPNQVDDIDGFVIESREDLPPQPAKPIKHPVSCVGTRTNLKTQARNGPAQRKPTQSNVRSTSPASKRERNLLPYLLAELRWDKNHLSNEQGVYCYCGKPKSALHAPMYRCCKCKQLFHPSCIDLPTDLPPLMFGDRSYEFECAVCNAGNVERFERLVSHWKDIVRVALLNLTLERFPDRYFHVLTTLCDFISSCWSRLCYARPFNNSWQNTVVAVVNLYPDIFSTDSKGSGGLSHSVLAQEVEPSFLRQAALDRTRTEPEVVAPISSRHDLPFDRPVIIPPRHGSSGSLLYPEAQPNSKVKAGYACGECGSICETAAQLGGHRKHCLAKQRAKKQALQNTVAQKKLELTSLQLADVRTSLESVSEGDVVWGKVPGKIWWPCVVLRILDRQLDTHAVSKDAYVKFLQVSSVPIWLSPPRYLPFLPLLKQLVTVEDPSLQKALQSAMTWKANPKASLINLSTITVSDEESITCANEKLNHVVGSRVKIFSDSNQSQGEGVIESLVDKTAATSQIFVNVRHLTDLFGDPVHDVLLTLPLSNLLLVRTESARLSDLSLCVASSSSQVMDCFLDTVSDGIDAPENVMPVHNAPIDHNFTHHCVDFLLASDSLNGVEPRRHLRNALLSRDDSRTRIDLAHELEDFEEAERRREKRRERLRQRRLFRSGVKSGLLDASSAMPEYECEDCGKVFYTGYSLGGHRRHGCRHKDPQAEPPAVSMKIELSHREESMDLDAQDVWLAAERRGSNAADIDMEDDGLQQRIFKPKRIKPKKEYPSAVENGFQCVRCHSVFPTGQALGGHRRSCNAKGSTAGSDSDDEKRPSPSAVPPLGDHCSSRATTPAAPVRFSSRKSADRNKPPRERPSSSTSKWKEPSVVFELDDMVIEELDGPEPHNPPHEDSESDSELDLAKSGHTNKRFRNDENDFIFGDDWMSEEEDESLELHRSKRLRKVASNRRQSAPLTSRGYACVDCGQYFDSGVRLGGHRKHCTVRTGKKIDAVDQSDGHATIGDTNMQDSHSGRPTMENPLGVENLSSLESSREQTPTATYSCDLCGLEFVESRKLGGHKRQCMMRHERQRIALKEARRVKTESVETDSHLWETAGDEAGDTSVKTDALFCCPSCGYATATEFALQKHWTVCGIATSSAVTSSDVPEPIELDAFADSAAPHLPSSQFIDAIIAAELAGSARTPDDVQSSNNSHLAPPKSSSSSRSCISCGITFKSRPELESHYAVGCGKKIPKRLQQAILASHQPEPPPCPPAKYTGEVVGRRVAIYWPLDRCYFSASVARYNSRRGKHLISYDDQHHEWLDLSCEQLRWAEIDPQWFEALTVVTKRLIPSEPAV
eukprot:GILJ01012183.1.p1 GENE.GILJ01012183.1~~GILJ01012183.1.p1  ORF type:complete len:1547 (+),score=174.95 GILJ01012183.1:137-4777(+)